MTESQLLEAAAEKRVLFVGERIVDVYHYVKPLGRPLKESIVSVEHISTETFAGGVTAAAEHAQSFCKELHIHSGGFVTRKSRWVEASHLRKLFEVYSIDGEHGGILPPLKPYDCVVVTDYGHGMMTKEIIHELCSKARFLAVNVQTNSGNYGFNLATKYPRADYLCVDEPEARLATQNRTGPIEDSLRVLGKTGQMVVITLGKAGSVGYSGGSTFQAPAFTDRVVDTLGAGDAFFAITALIAQQAPMDQLLKIGNAAGACKVGIVGHRRAITKDELIRYL